MDLFDIPQSSSSPLADRMRPQVLEDIVGQADLLGPGKFLRRLIEKDQIPSMILYGPPGCGKTTLAKVIAKATQAEFVSINAVASGVVELRKVLDKARDDRRFYGKKTVLFIDEIHRFNKSQQDALLPAVESGQVTLIGATTENPFFEVNSPLLSRSRVVQLKRLSEAVMIDLIHRALSDEQRGLGAYHVQAEEAFCQALARLAGGDARMVYNLLEQTTQIAADRNNKVLSVSILEEVAGQKVLYYDKQGDQHYDVASAFIKSMRGSDPDAALHYLARMLESGEDVKFIARRIVICAAEDVGNADPQALILANSCAQAVQFVGMPEARIILAQAVTYIAAAPKSNAAYLGIDKALEDVRQGGPYAVPLYLRDSHYSGAGKLGHGLTYLYPHDYPNHWVKQTYAPEQLQDKTYYEPSNQGYEAMIQQRLSTINIKKSK